MEGEPKEIYEAQEVEKEPEIIPMEPSIWHAKIQEQRRLLQREIEAKSQDLLRLQLEIMQKTRMIERYNEIETDAINNELEGMRTKYFLEDGQLCYSAEPKGSMGFRTNDANLWRQKAQEKEQKKNE